MPTVPEVGSIEPVVDSLTPEPPQAAHRFHSQLQKQQAPRKMRNSNRVIKVSIHCIARYHLHRSASLDDIKVMPSSPSSSSLSVVVAPGQHYYTAVHHPDSMNFSPCHHFKSHGAGLLIYSPACMLFRAHQKQIKGKETFRRFPMHPKGSSPSQMFC